MGKNLRIKSSSSDAWTPLLLDQQDPSGPPLWDLEHGDAVQPANIGFCRVLHLAKPDVGRLILATIALLIASTSSILIPKFGGKIVDIVSKDVSEPEQKAEALAVVKNTILYIVLIVVVE